MIVVAELDTPESIETMTPETEEEPVAPATFDCPAVGNVVVGDKDPRKLVGTIVNVPNKLWAGYEDDKNNTRCTIVGYSATTHVPNSKKAGAYVVEADEEYYALDAAYHIFKRSKKK